MARLAPLYDRSLHRVYPDLSPRPAMPVGRGSRSVAGFPVESFRRVPVMGGREVNASLLAGHHVLCNMVPGE